MLHPLIELNLNLVNTRLGYLWRTVADVKLLCLWRDTKSTIWEVYSVSQNESKLLNSSELWFVLNSLFPSKSVKFYVNSLQLKSWKLSVCWVSLEVSVVQISPQTIVAGIVYTMCESAGRRLVEGCTCNIEKEKQDTLTG